MIIIQKRRQKGLSVSAGSEILWYGVAAAIPEPWVIDNALSGLFVAGDSANSDTPSGSFSHHHNNQNATDEIEDHVHNTQARAGGTGSGSIEYFKDPVGYGGVVGAGHGHGDGPIKPSESGGKHAHPLLKTKTATVYPPYHRLYWIKTAVEAVVPVGGIIMFDAVIGNRPEGFNLCNGATYDTFTTPDLRDRFIWTAGEDAQVNNQGGSLTHTHGNDNVVAAGQHAHNASAKTAGASTSNNGYTSGISASGGHDHTVSAVTDADPDHIHTLGDTGTGSTLPPFLRLYYLMRTK